MNIRDWEKPYVRIPITKEEDTLAKTIRCTVCGVLPGETCHDKRYDVDAPDRKQSHRLRLIDAQLEVE